MIATSTISALVVLSLALTATPVHSSLVGHSAPIGPLAAEYPTNIRHVVVVLLENAEASTVLAKGSFERSLASTYAYAAHHYAVCHPSAPNYLALTSGQALQCGSDGYKEYDTTSIIDQLQHVGLSYAFYQQSMASACNVTNSYPYAVKHNPGVYYGSLVDATASCAAHDVVGLPAWTNATAPPSYAFVTPNLKNDGHDTNVTYADNWLKGWMTPLTKLSWFSSTVFFITYDEGKTGAGFGTLSGGHIYLSIVSSLTLGEGNIWGNTTHYNVLSTVEWLLDLDPTGHLDGTAAYPALSGIFS
jgi:hypothetical protein